MSTREQLIEAGLWDSQDLRDPSEDELATNDLMKQFEQYGLVSVEAEPGVWVVDLEGKKIAQGGTKLIAYCTAALYLAAKDKA